MNWILVTEFVYIIILILVSLRIVYDTQNRTKIISYLLLVIFLPLAGMIIYFTFGINYRKRKIYSKKLFDNSELEKKIEERIRKSASLIFKNGGTSINRFHKLANLVLNESLSPPSNDNKVELLLNGESKFPLVLDALKKAKHHIHIEYYIFNDDKIGCELIDLLIKKAKEGLTIRFIYDDFGSRAIRKKQVPRLKAAGVEAFPFYKIKLIALANRLNYRNHRKIIIIDGAIGFVGGVNVSDKYINQKNNEKSLFWRDTHLKISGSAVYILQYVFMVDWNYCSQEKLEPTKEYYPDPSEQLNCTDIVQIVASGPDSDTPLIQQSLMQAISLAQKELLITTPYFIPGDSLMDVLVIAAFSGVEVKLLVPGKSDSLFVNFAARSYYGRLLNAGAEIYCYNKGFVHAKTLVADGEVSIIGTANMDIRSFDLNFEVNAIVYENKTSQKLRDAFYDDIKYATKLELKQWQERPLYIQLLEKIAGLFSPIL